MRKVLLSMMLCCFASMMYAQSFDQERIALSKFIERMYNSSPFEGCRIVDDYDNSYLLSVVELDKSKYKTSSESFSMALKVIQKSLSVLQRVKKRVVDK